MNIPKSDNLHTLVNSSETRETVADSFASKGWDVHLLDDDKNTAHFKSDFAELTFTKLDKQEFLLNGAVHFLSENFVKIVKPLLELGILKERIKPDEIENWPI